MGFHADQEAARILGRAIDYARRGTGCAVRPRDSHRVYATWTTVSRNTHPGWERAACGTFAANTSTSPATSG